MDYSAIWGARKGILSLHLGWVNAFCNPIGNNDYSNNQGYQLPNQLTSCILSQISEWDKKATVIPILTFAYVISLPIHGLLS